MLLALFTLKRIGRYEVTYVKSKVDNRSYLVRDLPDKQAAADMLASIRKNIFYLSDYLYKNIDSYPEYKQNIEQLHDRIQNVVINESTEDGAYTSYSVNKGEQIVFCLRSRENGKLHDLNLVMYVALHEMAHVANPILGHGPEFKHIFAFLTNTAIQLGIYKKINFEFDPTEYCGLTITDSII